MRERLQAALTVGAELALARVREVGGPYASLADLETVVRELEPDGGTIVITAPAAGPASFTSRTATDAPDPADESARMSAGGK